MDKLHMTLIMKKSHELTKELKEEYKGIDYKFQLGLCMKYFISERKGIKAKTVEKLIEKYEALSDKYRERRRRLRDMQEEYVFEYGEHAYQVAYEKERKILKQVNNRIDELKSFVLAKNWCHANQIEKSVKRHNEKKNGGDIAKEKRNKIKSIAPEKEYMYYEYSNRVSGSGYFEGIIVSELVEGINTNNTLKTMAKTFVNLTVEFVKKDISEKAYNNTVQGVKDRIITVKGSEVKELMSKHNRIIIIEPKIKKINTKDNRGYNYDFYKRLRNDNGIEGTFLVAYKGKKIKFDLPVFKDMTLVYDKEDGYSYDLTWAETGVKLATATKVKYFEEQLKRMVETKEEALRQQVEGLLASSKITAIEIEQAKQVA